MLWTIVLIVVGVLVLGVVVLLVVAARRPDTFRYERSATIQAPPEKVFPFLTDFRKWRDWSPWEKMDPNLKREFSGAAEGRGAVYAWEGNKKVGQGRMEIVDAVAPNRVAVQLDFLKPFEARSTAEFTLAGRGDSTHVTWAMFGRQPFLFKVVGLVMNMDKAMGKNFEDGLASLKAAAEQ